MEKDPCFPTKTAKGWAWKGFAVRLAASLAPVALQDTRQKLGNLADGISALLVGTLHPRWSHAVDHCPRHRRILRLQPPEVLRLEAIQPVSRGAHLFPLLGEPGEQCDHPAIFEIVGQH